MGNLNCEKFLVMIILLLSFALLPPALSGSESHIETESDAGLALTIEEELISLDAEDTSLKEIIEEICSKMKLEVVGSIDSEEKVTLKFDKLSIIDALKKLTTSYGYTIDSENDKKITKIIVLPKGKVTASSLPTTNDSGSQEKTNQSGPFKFEFDP